MNIIIYNIYRNIMPSTKAIIRQKQIKYNNLMTRDLCDKWIKSNGKINPLTDNQISQLTTEGSPNVLISNACANNFGLFMENNKYIHPLNTKALILSRSPRASRSPQASRSPPSALRSPPPASRSSPPASRSPPPASRSPPPASRSSPPASRSSPPASRSPPPVSRKPVSRSKAVSKRREPGSVLSTKHDEIITALSLMLYSVTEKSTYVELKKILKDLINYEEVIDKRKNIENYNEPYYGEKSCEEWVENMKKDKYLKRHIFYNINRKFYKNEEDRDSTIYDNTNYYFKTIMYAFIYGLNLTEIPSIKKNILALKFIELLKLLFKKYDYKNDNELINEFNYLIYYRKYRLSPKIEEIYSEHNKIYDLTPPRFRPFKKENLKEIEYHLKRTLYVYNDKFQKSNDSKLYSQNYFLSS